MTTPAFVDRMDVADDADGRVAIFSVDGIPHQPEWAETSRQPRSGGFHAATDRIGAWLDSRYAEVAVAAALVVILVLGLLLSRH